MARMGQKPCRCILDHMRLGFVRIGVADHKAGIRVRQVKSEEVDLALYAPDDADGFTKVCLSMPRRMHQRHEHLLSSLTPAGHVILHNRDAACEAVLVPKPLKDPLRCMLLLLRACGRVWVCFEKITEHDWSNGNEENGPAD